MVPADLSSEGTTPQPNSSSQDRRRQTSAAQRLRARRSQLVIVLALGCGGVVGAVARYAVSRALPIASGQFPWNTFLINVTGSALLGFILIMLIEQFPRGQLVRSFIGTGVIGAYTTFSTFEVDAILLFRGHHLLVGVSYIVASLLSGLLAVWIGMSSARIALRVEQGLQGETQ
jgi:CrcB protein